MLVQTARLLVQNCYLLVQCWFIFLTLNPYKTAI
nr:MAG TPA: hypothetical protein [Caudoviricetes sp.]